MKKLLLTAVAALLLTACTSTPKALPYADDKALYTIGKKTINESDIYTMLAKQDDAASVFADIIDGINEKSNALEKYADEIEAAMTEEIKTLEASFGDNLDLVVQNAGYESLDQFIEVQLRPSIALQLEIKDYVKENLDAIVKDYQIQDVSLFATDDETLANSILEQLKEDTKASDIELDDKATLTESIASKSTDTKSELVNTYLGKTKDAGISDVIYDKESEIYYVVQIHDTDFESNLDAVVNILVQTEAYAEEYTATLFKEAKLKFYDGDLESMFKALKPGYID